MINPSPTLKPPVSRQVQRTRQALRDALIGLIREMPYEQIDIQAIADHANTARITFYRHYRTKDELLLDYLDFLYQELRAVMQQVRPADALNLELPPPNLPLFRLIDQDRALYKTLMFGPLGTVIQLQVRRNIVEQITLILQEAVPSNGDSLNEAVNHIASCTVGNLLWWLTDGSDYSAEQMARLTHAASITGALMILDKRDWLLWSDQQHG